MVRGALVMSNRALRSAVLIRRKRPSLSVWSHTGEAYSILGRNIAVKNLLSTGMGAPPCIPAMSEKVNSNRKGLKVLISLTIS